MRSLNQSIRFIAIAAYALESDREKNALRLERMILPPGPFK